MKEHVDVFRDGDFAAALGAAAFFDFEQDVRAVLEGGGWYVGLGPPPAGFAKVDVAGDEGAVG